MLVAASFTVSVWTLETLLELLLLVVTVVWAVALFCTLELDAWVASVFTLSLPVTVSAWALETGLVTKNVTPEIVIIADTTHLDLAL